MCIILLYIVKYLRSEFKRERYVLKVHITMTTKIKRFVCQVKCIKQVAFVYYISCTNNILF